MPALSLPPGERYQVLAAMEKRPFDGLICRLSGGYNAFVTKPLEPATFAEDERILRDLRFTRFTDTDEYVWCYSERMNWWKDQTPPGLEAAIVNARQKIAEGKPLGFDIEPLIETVGKRPLSRP